jgi:molybdate transport system substrate-binding protein
MDGTMDRARSKRFPAIFPVIMIFFILSSSSLRARDKEEILVSAAISLKDAFKEISSVYEKRTGIRVRLNLGASGLLQKQIEAGAPADVYASAGVKQMDALEAGGWIVPETRRSFVRNRLVLVVPAGSTPAMKSFADLAGPSISRLAIGNPKTVPAGQYARQSLKKLALWDRLESRLVPAENVRQVLDYVARGEVDAGIVYASDVSVSRGIAVVAAQAPEDSHDPILYPVAVVTETEFPREAAEFIDLVLDDSGQAIMRKYGFLPMR